MLRVVGGKIRNWLKKLDHSKKLFENINIKQLFGEKTSGHLGAVQQKEPCGPVDVISRCSGCKCL